MGNNVTSIGDYAFRNCSKLTSISIEANVNYIGQYAFQGCSSLQEIIFKRTSKWYKTTSPEPPSAMVIFTVDVTNYANNAKMLVSEYANYFWHMK